MRAVPLIFREAGAWPGGALLWLATGSMH